MLIIKSFLRDKRKASKYGRDASKYYDKYNLKSPGFFIDIDEVYCFDYERRVTVTKVEEYINYIHNSGRDTHLFGGAVTIQYAEQDLLTLPCEYEYDLRDFFVAFFDALETLHKDHFVKFVITDPYFQHLSFCFDQGCYECNQVRHERNYEIVMRIFSWDHQYIYISFDYRYCKENDLKIYKIEFVRALLDAAHHFFTTIRARYAFADSRSTLKCQFASDLECYIAKIFERIKVLRTLYQLNV